MQARLKSPAMNEQFKAFAIKALKANSKSEAEQQARVKQLQGQFVEKHQGPSRGRFPAHCPQERAPTS
jgi:hypothetical protein